MTFPIEVTLTRPIVVGGDTVSVLVFDEPTIGAQIDYAELEAELGLDDLRQKILADGDVSAQAELMPPTVSMRITQFWIEALADLPKGAARKIRSSDQAAVHAAVNAILNSDRGDGASDAVGNDEKASQQKT